MKIDPNLLCSKFIMLKSKYNTGIKLKNRKNKVLKILYCTKTMIQAVSGFILLFWGTVYLWF